MTSHLLAKPLIQQVLELEIELELKQRKLCKFRGPYIRPILRTLIVIQKYDFKMGLN